MEERKFSCKMEEVPVLAGFVADSLVEDLPDFQDYSSDYGQPTVDALVGKRNFCLELEKSNSKIQELKSTTVTLLDKELQLRPMLNKVEGYIKRASESLKIAVDGFGLKEIRVAISNGNDEGIISGLKVLMGNIDRNRTALEAKGLKPEFVTELNTLAMDIDGLNNLQNQLQNQRNSTTSTNIKDYNELWSMTNNVCQDARAIYKGVDEVKLKKYSISALLKRVNASGAKAKVETKTV